MVKALLVIQSVGQLFFPDARNSRAEQGRRRRRCLSKAASPSPHL